MENTITRSALKTEIERYPNMVLELVRDTLVEGYGPVKAREFFEMWRP